MFSSSGSNPSLNRRQKRNVNTFNGDIDNAIPDLQSLNSRDKEETKTVSKEESSFVFYQFSIFMLSVCGLIAYTVHWYLFVDGSDSRAFAHIYIEIILVILRGLNESYGNKLVSTDIIHHSMFVLGAILCFSYEPFRAYTWLVCHMQCLHIPMALWYYGCRTTAIVPLRMHKERATYRNIFPPMWLLAVSYRVSLMCSTALNTFTINGDTQTAAIIALLGIIFASLDYYWTSMFLKQTGMDWVVTAVVLVCVGVAGGSIVSSTGYKS